MKKKIVRLTPAAGVTLEEADRHYLEVHFRFAADTFRSDVGAVVAYHTNRATGQFDLTGGFGQRPDAWRFVVTTWDDAGDAGHAVGWLPDATRRLFFHDRVNCIDEVSACEVEESVVVDHLTRQTALAKYVFRYEPEQVGPVDEFERYYCGEHLPALARAAEAAAGLRLFLTNRVLREAEVGVDGRGHSEYTGGYVAVPSTHRYEEYWFDDVADGADFFGSPAVLSALRDGPYGKVPGYRVEERCGVDRR